MDNDLTMTVVLQKWLNKWYMGHITEYNEDRIKVHLRGRKEELDQWFDRASSSIRYQNALVQPNTNYLPKCDDLIRCFLVDAKSQWHKDAITPVGKVLKSYSARDSALVELTLLSEILTVEVGNQYLRPITEDEYAELYAQMHKTTQASDDV